MGSDQSSLSGGKRGKGRNNPKRSHSAGTDKDNELLRRNKSYDSSSSSRRPSICSDSDIPYVSYTATRPISEEITYERRFKWSISSSSDSSKPKTRDKIINREKRDNKAKSVGSIVTVKQAAEAPTLEKDPLYKRLEEIPQFTPIIREKPGVPWTKNPEITEKIDPLPLIRIAYLYQKRMRKREDNLRVKQDRLSHQIQETDAQVYHIMMILNNREKTYSSFVEVFSKISDLTKSLSYCHYALNKTIETIETLNNMLDMDERLEPFVWTTG